MKRIFYLLLLLSGNAFCQNTIGLPEITTYTKQVYGAGAQNRQIRQDRNGLMYFANNEGLVSFDGNSWKTYPLPNKSIIRSLEFGPDNRLYVGGQDELGYFFADKLGMLSFHSLKNLIPEEDRSFTDVWEIYFYQGKAFFQTSNKIFELDKNQCTVYKSTHWRFITLYNNELIAQDFTNGLLKYVNGVWTPFLKDGALPKDCYASSLINIGRDSALLTTVKHGVFIYANKQLKRVQSPALNFISGKFISGAALVNDQHIALSTNLQGCFIIDKKGALIQSFGRKEGLQNNNILDIYLDRDKNIWLGLDNGIDFIAYNNAIKHIYPDLQNEGSGYASIIYNDKLYLGTSNGLYNLPITSNSPADLSYVKGFFEPVKNTSGQVWNLSEVNGQLLLGHNDGSFLIKENNASVIDNTSGFWGFFPFYNVLPSSLIVAGTYQGINFYTYSDGKVINKNRNAHFESARFVVVENNTIWIAHPYKGIFRVTINAKGNPEVKQFTKKEGLNSVNGNYVFKVGGRIVLTGESGIYEYNSAKGLFEPSGYYNALLGGKHIRYLKEDGAGNVWFVFDKIIGVIDKEAKKHRVLYLPELTNKFVSGFEHVYPVNINNVFIGGEKGFYHINYALYKKNSYQIQVRINNVTANGQTDSVLFGGYFKEVNGQQSQQEPITVKHSLNSFHFNFSSPVYAQQSTITYSFFLKGYDAKWSDYAKRTEKEYTNLPAGQYVFEVKAKNNLETESAISQFAFRVLPPWYQTFPAYAFYLLLFAFLIYLLIGYQKKKFKNQQHKYEEEQKRLQYLHHLEIEKTEKEIVKLKNEKLEAEIAHQNTALASSAMHLLQKGELLTNLKEELKRLTKDVEDEKTAHNFKKMIKVLGEDDRMDKDWEHFAHHFDKVQSDFLSGLKKIYPALSPNELKLSAYLRMNLSSKEIAQLMNISVRGVEISRYRLRKKLQIPPKTDLFDFLISLQLPAPNAQD